jgi:hypothetical protein
MSETPDLPTPGGEGAGMCPHCGLEVGVKHGLTRLHRDPDGHVCRGSEQNPRNAESDARPLWNGKRNERFCG